jgi:hypothetical protein
MFPLLHFDDGSALVKVYLYILVSKQGIASHADHKCQTTSHYHNDRVCFAGSESHSFLKVLCLRGGQLLASNLLCDSSEPESVHVDAVFGCCVSFVNEQEL